MLKRLQSPRMFELGDSASITKLRRASKMEFDVHGMCGSLKMLSIGSLVVLCGLRSFRGASLVIRAAWRSYGGRRAHSNRPKLCMHHGRYPNEEVRMRHL